MHEYWHTKGKQWWQGAAQDIQEQKWVKSWEKQTEWEKETWIIQIGKKVKGEKERNAAGCSRKDEEEEKWLEGIASLSLIIRVRMNPAPLEAVRDNQTHPDADTHIEEYHKHTQMHTYSMEPPVPTQQCYLNLTQLVLQLVTHLIMYIQHHFLRANT